MKDTHERFMSDLEALFNEVDVLDFSASSLKKLNKEALEEKCKTLSLDTAGTKRELISRLLSHKSSITVLDANSTIEIVTTKGVKGDRV